MALASPFFAQKAAAASCRDGDDDRLKQSLQGLQVLQLSGQSAALGEHYSRELRDPQELFMASLSPMARIVQVFCCPQDAHHQEQATAVTALLAQPAAQGAWRSA